MCVALLVRHHQLHEFDDAARVHLLHELRPTVFDGSGAEAQVGGDFLVHLAFEDEVQHLAFAGGELAEAFLGLTTAGGTAAVLGV
jgi:hypothetical protein